MKTTKTQRGFAVIEFKDRNGVDCKIQKSSIATEDCIWFGAKEIGLKRLAGGGWQDVELEQSKSVHHIANTSMHLTRQQVKKLLPILQKFVETGEVSK